MSGNSNNSPMIKVAGLWQKTSVKGGQYLTGRLGGVKVLVMENRDRKSDDDPSHNLFFVEASDRRQGAGERPQERSGGAGAGTHPGRLRTHQRRTAAASLGIGTGCPTIRRRSTSTTLQNGRADMARNTPEATKPASLPVGAAERLAEAAPAPVRTAEEQALVDAWQSRPRLQRSPR